MRKLTIGSKTHRAVEFLLGSRDAQVARELEPFGFTNKDLDEGWDLVAHATGLRLAGATLPPSLRPRLLSRIDEFENTWFPVARGTLARHYPEVGRQLFMNLVQTQGRETAVSVLTFLTRLEKMARGEEPFGADGPAARKLLSVRGLTEAREADARAMMEEMRDVKDFPPDPPLSVEEQRAAEEALWAWYLEWSNIARVAIKSRALLRTLGFFKRRSAAASREGDDGMDLDPIDVDEPVPDVPVLDGRPEGVESNVGLVE